MYYSQANPVRGDVSSALSLQVGFAEPDWRGDDDFGGQSEAVDLDDLMSDLAARIDDGVRRGWLDAYYSRRAAFDLQSIRCQIDRERRKPEAAADDADRRAILSRIDRLSRLLTTPN